MTDFFTQFVIPADSEEEELGPRLKPVFVRKKDRLTVAEREKQAEKDRIAEIEAKRALEDRKRQTIKVQYILNLSAFIYSICINLSYQRI